MNRISISNILSAFAACAVLFSCSETAEEPTVPPTDSAISPKIQHIIDIANDAFESFYPSDSRSSVRNAKAGHIKAVCQNLSRGETDTLIYVVNYENNNGFALISAKDTINPVLAVVPHGSYDPEIGTDNPGFNMFMEAAAHQAANIDTTETIKPRDPYVERWDGKLVKIEPRLDLQYGPTQRIKTLHGWGQGGIYGQFCPTGRTGSAAISIASITAYLRYFYSLNNRINYTYPGADIPYEDIEWIEIFRHHNSAAYFLDGSHVDHICWAADKDAVHKSIGRICRQISYDAKTKYDYSQEPTVNKSDIPGVLRKYLPEFDVSEFAPFATFKTMNFINVGLVYLRAHRNNNPNIIHDWYTDGYKYQRYEDRYYVSDPPGANGAYHWEYWQSKFRSYTYNSMKWCWDGEYDGWYSTLPVYVGNTSEPFVDIEFISITEKK